MKHINVSGKKYMVQFLPYQTKQKINLMKFTINTSIVQKKLPFNFQFAATVCNQVGNKKTTPISKYFELTNLVECSL